MYGLFYPENNERVPIPNEFYTASDAADFWNDKRESWKQIKAAGEDDIYAFMSPFGAIVVVRELPATPDGDGEDGAGGGDG